MKYAPYFIECSFKKKRFKKQKLNFAIWLDIEIIKQNKSDFSTENTAVDFLICPDGKSCPRSYNFHLYRDAFFESPEQKGIQLEIRQVSNFICYTLTNIPVIDRLDISRAQIMINLFSNFYKGYPFGEDAFFQNIPLQACLAKKEMM